MAEITAFFDGRNGSKIAITYFSDADAFRKRRYSGLELKNIAAELKGKTRPEISDNGIYSLRSTAVVGTIPPRII